MDTGILTEEKDVALIQQMVEEIVAPRGYKDIKANFGDYETPARLSRKNSNGEDTESFIPDATGVINGRKSYFELAMKSDSQQATITKWKLMSSIAHFKRGKLYLIAPRGHYAFVDRLLKLYPINAEVLKLS